MGAIPTQRETVPRAPSRAPGALARRGADRRTVAHATLGGGPLAPGAARGLVRAALAEWARLGLPGAAALPDRLTDDAMVVVSELVTNAVVHAGTDVELQCRLETPGGPEEGERGAGDEEEAGVGVALVVEVSDHHPSRAPGTAVSNSRMTYRSTGVAFASSPCSPRPGASPTAPVSRPSGRGSPPKV